MSTNNNNKVEWLATTRSRRTNAGSNMSKLLDQEEMAKDEFYKTTYGGFEENESDTDFDDADTSDSENVVDSDFDIDENAEVVAEEQDDDDDGQKSKRKNNYVYKDPKAKRSKVSRASVAKPSKKIPTKRIALRKHQYTALDEDYEGDEDGDVDEGDDDGDDDYSDSDYKKSSSNRKSRTKKVYSRSAEIESEFDDSSAAEFQQPSTSRIPSPKKKVGKARGGKASAYSASKNLRQSTLKSTQLTKELVIHRKKHKRTKKKEEYRMLTQKELLEEAKETEIKNTRDLLYYQSKQKELNEKSKRQLLNTPKITGPSVIYRSFTAFVPVEPTSPPLVNGDACSVVAKPKMKPVTINEIIFPDDESSRAYFGNVKPIFIPLVRKDKTEPEIVLKENIMAEMLEITTTAVALTARAPEYPEPEKKLDICPITGQVARYFDPLTKTPYYDVAAFQTIRHIYELKLKEEEEKAAAAAASESSSLSAATSASTSVTNSNEIKPNENGQVLESSSQVVVVVTNGDSPSIVVPNAQPQPQPDGPILMNSNEISVDSQSEPRQKPRVPYRYNDWRDKFARRLKIVDYIDYNIKPFREYVLTLKYDEEMSTATSEDDDPVFYHNWERNKSKNKKVNRRLKFLYNKHHKKPDEKTIKKNNNHSNHNNSKSKKTPKSTKKPKKTNKKINKKRKRMMTKKLKKKKKNKKINGKFSERKEVGKRYSIRIKSVYKPTIEKLKKFKNIKIMGVKRKSIA